MGQNPGAWRLSREIQQIGQFGDPCSVARCSADLERGEVASSALAEDLHSECLRLSKGAGQIRVHRYESAADFDVLAFTGDNPICVVEQFEWIYPGMKSGWPNHRDDSPLVI
jgi:hypothetical protein